MAIALVQSNKNTNGAATVSVTWSGSTTTGNFLVAVIVAANGAATAGPSGGGWSQAGSDVANGTNRVAIWYKENAASQSSTGNFTSAAATRMNACVAEFSGIATSSPLDKVSAGATGNSTTIDTGTTAATTQNDELGIGGLERNNDETFTSPTNSYTIQQSQTSGALTLTGALLYRILSATGTQNTGATCSSGNWSGLIATFKASAGGGATTTSQAICIC